MIQNTRRGLLSQLKAARSRSDELFSVIHDEALYERPIPERHRVVFYLGHLEAFDWNLICTGLFGMHSFQPEFDRLFAFGIDPTNGNLPQDQTRDWPREPEIIRYNARVRDSVDACLNRASDDLLFWVAVEHRLMHVETLAYMLHWLPYSMKKSQPVSVAANERHISNRPVNIPSGEAKLGLPRNGSAFGWDNEFDEHEVPVPEFAIDEYKVTNAEYLEFVSSGGYQERKFWTSDAWTWITTSGIEHPRFWKKQGDGWVCPTIFADVAFQPSWPVYVSHAEAEAFARWKGKSLPTELQFHRAAFGTPNGIERPYPWGNDQPALKHGNFDFNGWTPVPVDAHPAGTSAFGVAGLVGNGWEWTSTLFGPFEGFKAFDFYPGYSADFFDGKHYVMKGGSARTASLLLRRSFRNWFQPHYPNIYASFRCVEN